MLILIFATLFATFLLALSSASSVSSRVPRVSTTSGILSGSSTDNVNTFLGVPYAQPPIGDLRWKTALPINSSRTAFDATRFGAGCGQLLIPGYASVFSTANITLLPTNQSEDCLSLNIWAPKNAKRLPVIIFVHGGGYQYGVSSTAMYHGDHVAETGRAIFVSINYRLNIWGFPSSTPVDGFEQNIGITDVRLAIEWVATNIAQFGGDPAQIIFSGQSAGAGIGEQLLYAFEKDSIFVGQIIQTLM
jgi:carboxylesterase type B